MNSFVQKAVPVIIRSSENLTELLLFHHPKAGDQIVKGTIEENESPEEAAIRELFEESGIENVAVSYKLGQKDYPSIHQTWHFFMMKQVIDLPDSWKHFANDDGGLNLEFFWQDINIEISSPFPEIFDDARLFIKEKLEL